MDKSKPKKLKQISPRDIQPNPENPRIVFRQEEMESLMVSISEHGIQVPISVFEHKGSFYLIDGERRWRCAKKLALDKIPTIIQDQPTELENLLLMSNIHALREQWDYFTIAKNLKRIVDLFTKERRDPPKEVELSKETGLTRGQIRRCQLLMEMPPQFEQMLMKELSLPKSRQKITEDFFIEMERSLKTVIKRLPQFDADIDNIRSTLVDKFRGGAIEAVTDFRQLSKIATAIDNIGIKKRQAESALKRLFNPKNSVGIREVYEHTVEFGYDEKKAIHQIDYLNQYFETLLKDDLVGQLDEEFMQRLHDLHEYLQRILGGK